MSSKIPIECGFGFTQVTKAGVEDEDKRKVRYVAMHACMHAKFHYRGSKPPKQSILSITKPTIDHSRVAIAVEGKALVFDNPEEREGPLGVSAFGAGPHCVRIDVNVGCILFYQG